MSDRPTPEAFVVPAGLRLEDIDGALGIEHDGDIILHSTLGRPLARVRSNHGDVRLHVDVQVRELAAPRGTVAVAGDLQADSVVGRHVEVKGDLKAQGVYGGGLTVGGDVDVVRIQTDEGDVRIGGRARVSDELSTGQGDIEVAGELEAGSVSTPAGSVTVGGAARVRNVTTSGDASFRDDVRAHELRVGGNARVGGEIEAHSLRAQVVEFDGRRVDVRMVQGRDRIRVGAARVTSDLFIAPQIALDANTAGRITVVESRNALGPNSLKGCLGLEDLASLIGDVDQFLADRGLERLDGDAVPVPRPVADAAAAAREAAEREAREAREAAEREAREAAEREAREAAEAAARAEREAREAAELEERIREEMERDESEARRVREAARDAERIEARDIEERIPDRTPTLVPDEEERPSREGRPDVAASIEDLFDIDTNALGLERTADGDAPLRGDADAETLEAPGAEDADDDYSVDAVLDLRERRSTDAAVDDRPPRVAAPTPVTPVFDDLEDVDRDADVEHVEHVEVRPPRERPEEDDTGRLMLVEDPDSLIPVPEPAPQPAPTPAPAPRPAPAPAPRPAPAPAPAPPSRADLQDPIHMLMLETVGRMSSCYGPDDTPPPVSTLRSLVENRDYDTIRSDFGALWNDLIAWHRDQGVTLQPKVSHTFRTVDTIVRNL